MNDKELKQMWQSYNNKLEEILVVNRQMTEELTRVKIRRSLSKVKPVRYLGIIVGIPFVILLHFLCFVGIQSGGFYFPLAMGVIAITMDIAIIIYFYHLILIYLINNSNTISSVQEKIAKIKKSDIIVAKVSMIQIPFWSMITMDLNGGALFSIIHGIIFLLMTVFALYLIVNIKSSNMDMWWMRFLFSGNEWDSILEAEDMLEEVSGMRSKN